MGTLFSPWRRTSTWWALVFCALDGPAAFVTLLVLGVLFVVGVATIVVFPIAIVAALAFFWVAHLFATVERTRLASLLTIDLRDPVPPLTKPTWLGRFGERFASGPRWREIAYFAVLAPLGLLTMVVVLAAWCGSVALLALPLYVGDLPGGTAKFGLFEIGSGTGAYVSAAVGLVGLVFLAPWATVLLARLGGALSRPLLGLSPQAEYERRMRELETSRTAAVDSAEAERRRIERDLHDGAQQRLVSLAMNLGAARERLEHDPEGGLSLVTEAHEEAKAALEELRGLVRGVHPVILEDRGLDAALSAIVARSPVPVELHVDVPIRPSAPVESTAYFVVAEALTNVARHARARHAWVSIVRAGGRLIVEVRDDGVGGADEAGGTGLAGLRERVAALQGTMRVISPLGGPTTLLVELPCG
jgi:signal transduction histidine kinase